jgi:tol-pal system protein YbgF
MDGSSTLRTREETPVKNFVMPIFLVVSAVACSTLSPQEDPVYLKMTDLEARLMRIERVFENESLIQLAGELDRLQSETASLRGELETLRFESESSASRQRDLYVDVDQRLQSLEAAQARSAFTPPPVASNRGASSPGAANDGAVSSPPPQQPAAAAPPPRPAGTDQQNYQAAFELIQARRYPEAGRAFTGFLEAFPSSPLADNAQYWLAETYYVQRQFQQALPEFQKVVDQYPQSAKLADALLKVGYCNDELENTDGARAALQQVMRQFPDTTAARLASQRLERLSP